MGTPFLGTPFMETPYKEIIFPKVLPEQGAPQGVGSRDTTEASVQGRAPQLVSLGENTYE